MGEREKKKVLTPSASVLVEATERNSLGGEIVCVEEIEGKYY